MCLFIYAAHLLEIEIPIDLRRRDIGMTQHLLNTLSVRAVLHQMCSKGMAQRMRCDIRCDPGS